MDHNLHFYQQNAEQLASLYDALDFEQVHACWQPFWPNAGDMVLDVGAGSGRDAQWMQMAGCSVTAVEPTLNLRQIGEQLTQGKVRWVDDHLPCLRGLSNESVEFDLVLVSAVWMHLDRSQQLTAIVTLSKLVKAGGNLVVTLRHGGFSDGRTSHSISFESLIQDANNIGLKAQHRSQDAPDAMGRQNVWWETVVLRKERCNEES